MNDTAALEGLIFLAGEEGLSLLQLQAALPHLTRMELHTFLAGLQEEYARDTHGFYLTEYGGRYRFITKDALYPVAEKLFGSQTSASLSPAALETLAVIAYRQPVTRTEIEEIRGVSCDAILKKLQALGLVAAKDRLDAVGKPLLYRVTDAFLDTFALHSLEELPALENESPKDLFTETEK